MRRFASLLVVLAVGCSGAPAPSPAPVADPPFSDPATWSRYSAEQLARIHFRTRYPHVRMELVGAEINGPPERMDLSYSANDLDRYRWFKVNVVGGQTEQFDEREGRVK